MVTRKRTLRDIRRQARTGAALTAIATILSSCAAMVDRDDPLVESAGFTGQPLPLLRGTSASLAADERIAGAPLQLARRVDQDWVDDLSEAAEAGHPATGRPVVPGGDGADDTSPVHVAEWTLDPRLPILVSDEPDRLIDAAGEVASAETVVDEPAMLPEEDLPDLVVEDGMHEPVVDERPVGEPLQLVIVGRRDWVATWQDDAIVAERPVGEPLRLVMSDRPDWVATWQDDAIVAERPVGEPLQLVMSDRPDWVADWTDEPVVAAHAVERAHPLVLSDGSYHWPDQAGGATELTAAPCPSADDKGPTAADCTVWGDQIALADTAIDDAALSELRGGFVTVGGFQIDFGFYVETIVDGVTELTSALTLDSMLAGQAASGIPIVNSALIAGSGETVTSVEHILSASEIGATIANTQSDIDITNVVTLAIDVIDLRHVETGAGGHGLPRMPLELQQSIIRGIAR